MVQEKVTVSARGLHWRCVESRADNKRHLYGRFILSPLMKGQADTIGIALRRALLAEMEGTAITRAKFEKVPHEYSTIRGIQESVHEILMNLKEIVLRSNLYGTCEASICVKGPGYVTAQDIISPPYVEIVDNTQHIASLTEPIELIIGLQIEKNIFIPLKGRNNFQDGSYAIDALFMPVRHMNYSIHSSGNDKQEILFLEIWTNGSLTPKEALHEACRNVIDLFIPFLHTEEGNLENNQHGIPFSSFPFYDKLTKQEKKKMVLQSIFIDQSELHPSLYNCLQSSNIYTLFDFVNNSQEDLKAHLHIEDVKKILGLLEKYLI